jgi:SAM-dependent methyltransferase
VLDIGCGSGRLAGILEDYDDYLGIDLSEELLKIAMKKFPSQRFMHGDMRDLSMISSTTFDTIFFIASLHHVLDEKEQGGILSHTRDLLNPNGRIVLLNWNLKSEKNRARYSGNQISENVLDIPFAGHSRHYYAFDLEILDALFSQTGLRIKKNIVSQTADNFIGILEK